MPDLGRDRVLGHLRVTVTISRSRLTLGLPPRRQFEPHHALELPFGLAAGLRVDLGLALLAEVVGLQVGERAAFDRLLAALLDESAEHRSLAFLGRQLHA